VRSLKLVVKPERMAELQVLAIEIQRWSDEGLAHEQQCMSCHTSMYCPSDLEPTALCNLCAQRTADDLPDLIADLAERDRLIAELQAKIQWPPLPPRRPRDGDA